MKIENAYNNVICKQLRQIQHVYPCSRISERAVFVVYRAVAILAVWQFQDYTCSQSLQLGRLFNGVLLQCELNKIAQAPTNPTATSHIPFG